MKKFFTFVAAAFAALTINAETITVAQAVEIGLALDSMGLSTEEYTVEGYVIKTLDFSIQYMNQSFYLADEASATESQFEGFNCYPIDGADTVKVLVGDKVSLTGKIKHYKNKKGVSTIEIEKADVTFISKVEGDRSIDKSAEEIGVAKALEIGAALADGASTPKQYAITGYVSAINVKSSDAWSDQYKNQSFWVADDANSTAQTNADGAFYVYRGKPTTGEALAPGTKVKFTCAIKKYGTGDNAVIENADQNIAIEVLEAPKVDTLSAAEAKAACEALPVGGTKFVAVKALVASIKTPYSAEYGNITVWLNDDPASTYGDIQAYRAKCSAEDGAAIAEHDLVLVVGTLSHTQYEKDGEMKDSYQIAAGAELKLLEKAQGIENIELTEKVQKVVVDGVIYIIRDNKMFNVQGTQVR